MIFKKTIAMILCLALLWAAVPSSIQTVEGDEFKEAGSFVPVFNGKTSVNDAKKISINATAAVVMDKKSGRVLYEKNAGSRRAIASTTKIMTAILAIEKGNLDDNVTVSKRAASVWGSTLGIKEGQVYKLRELLYGLMLCSGNDAAIAIAEHIGGSVEEFARMMTAKAVEIGAVNSQFKSPHGLDMDGHYSTAYDLALITRHALNNPVFSGIVGTKTASIPNNGQVYNTNELLGVYPGADGVKTGYTGQAGRCLVTSVTRNGWRIISVVLGSPTRTARAQSSSTILDYAFNNYKNYTLLKKGESIASLPVIKGKQKEVDVEAGEDIVLPMRSDEAGAVEKEVVLPENLESPVYGNIEVGSISYSLNGKIIAQVSVKTVMDVPRKGVIDYLGDVLHGWFRLSRYIPQP